MNKDWLVLIKKYTVSGARDRFETICTTLFKKIYTGRTVRSVKVKKGDGGIDIFVGDIGVEPIQVIQCKFFSNEFGDSQKAQVRESFKTAINSKEYKMHNWTLCVICSLDLNENKWWSSWKDKMKNKYHLAKDFIKLIDGESLIDLLNENDLYNTAFENEDSIKIDEIHKSLISNISLEDFLKSINKASLFLSKVKNHFEKLPSTHIERIETKNILYWVKNELESKQKNILILEGDKGLGKSVILKDVYENLKNDNRIVLGIKADKYYASSPKELENKLFLNENISFSKIIEVTRFHKKQLIVIIDQLDALSQTLSTNREYIQTYNRIINELADEKHIRIIISSRSYDLKYDAELRVYKSNEYKNINVTLLSEDSVKNTLNKFDISCTIKKVIELLRTPNHLEIFCKLPNKKKINLNTLSSLKDLYDELWNTIIANQDKLQLSKVLYKIAVEMYEQQQIIVKKGFIQNFKKELGYLLSNQLLVIEDSNVQFFHQTFYDYCFARQFVESKYNIYEYLRQNQQNLEIRSIVKMVFEYLREFDPSRYLKYSKDILKSSKYRFHLKSLIINNLGTVSPSNEEKKLFQKFILKNKKYEDFFINSVFSDKWIEYLISQKIPNKYLFVEKKNIHSIYHIYKKQSFFRFEFLEKYNLEKIKEKNKNSIWILFRNNIHKVPFKIITYLDSLPDFENKQNFVERIIYGLSNWEDKRMIPYFEKYFSFEENTKGRDNFWYYQLLEKIFEYHPGYVFEKTKPILENRFDNNDSWYSIDFNHDQVELIKKMYNLFPEKTFQFLFDIYITVIDNNKRAENYEEINSPFYDCLKFYDGLSSSKEAHIVIQEFLLKHLLDKKNDKGYILNFYVKYKHSNSNHIIRLILLFFKEVKSEYINEIFELINIIYLKNGFNSYDNNFQLFLRQLIGVSYSLFDDSQKEEITEILLSIKYPYDCKARKYNDPNGNPKVYFTKYGVKQYLFLSLLPLNEINKNPKIKKVFQELQRKFGDVDANKARDVSSSIGTYVVGAPLENKAYKKMDLKSWNKSFVKFDDNYKEGHGPKGGLTEHSRAFNEEVKQNPDRFYDFILNLFDDETISITYISSGINGLIEGKYDPVKVKLLLKKLIRLELDRSQTLYTIWKTDYLIEHKLIDEEIISFLAKNALNHPNPQKPLNENDPAMDSLNSVRGSAIHKIMRCYEHKEFSELIFSTVEEATNDSQTSVKVAILQKLAFLNHLDLDRSFKIFKKLIVDDNVQILENSIRVSQYFNNVFHNEMIPYFEKIIKNKVLHKKGQVIVLSYLIEKINDKELFELFFKSSKEAKLCAFKIAEANLINKEGEIDDKSLNILNRLLGEKDKDFSSSFSGLVLRKIKNKNFEEFYPFLKTYSKTSLCLDEPRYFLQLLLKCAKDYPLECLQLVENMNLEKTPNIQERGYYSEEPVQLILAIYSKLNLHPKKNRKSIKKSLDIFDVMLTHSHLRVSANKAIEMTL